MSLITSKCTNCGATIKVNPESKTGICEFCGAEYVTQDVINNYYVNNNYSTVQYVTKNVTSNGSLEAEEYIRNGDIFLSLNMLGKAKSAFFKAVELNPGDWRAWFGLVKACTNNLTDYEDNTHYEYYTKAQKVATPEQLVELKNCYAPYQTKHNEIEKIERLKQEERLENERRLKAEQKRILREAARKKRIMNTITIIVLSCAPIIVIILTIILVNLL